MAKTTTLQGLMAGCLLVATATSTWAAPPPTVQAMLQYKPDFADVQISTPTPDEYATCEIKYVTGTIKGSGGWMLLDPRKQPLRLFFSRAGQHVDTYSYYKDGLEVFREIDDNQNGRKDQYRWLNSAGMKWGSSTQEDGKIDAWQYISAEEVTQEVFAALATGDLARLQALFITQPEMRSMKLPPEEAQRMIGLAKGAPAKFQATRAKLPQLNAKARFVRVESATPSCVPAEANGTDKDQLRFSSRTILFESGDKEKKHDFVQTGEMIQVGMAWRLVDGPSISDGDINPGPAAGTENLALRKLYDDLTNLDNSAPAPLSQPKTDVAVQSYNLRRVTLIGKILEQVKGAEQETWYKQIFDNLSAAYQAGNTQSLTILTERRDQIVKAMPGSNLAAYATYRHLWASYAEKLISTNAAKVQDEWLNQLEKFATAYPKADDTPDALWQLAMGSEYGGKDEEAKRWYARIYQAFPSHPLAPKAIGSEKRLNLIGQPLQLAGPQLGTNAAFDIASLKGKVVVVYYWASTVSVCERDFDTLKRLRNKHAGKMELVCVNLDDTAATANAFLRKAQVPGIHLFQAAADGSGLNSPLSTFYGINGLPHLFLVGGDGRVIDRTLQVGDLDAALNKAL